ncbi:hypothetical protein [Prevotella sp. 10(H)]|uniref:hypothetical protein n=1 Tax=Prevotella sp. 10(H) TaxID=1158294 RepID=UPI0004A6E96E|nr:hypothetical protein [Prevotella sp. 10(H)]
MKRKLATTLFICVLYLFSGCKVVDGVTTAWWDYTHKDYEYEEVTVKDQETGKEKKITIKKEKK